MPCLLTSPIMLFCTQNLKRRCVYQSIHLLLLLLGAKSKDLRVVVLLCFVLFCLLFGRFVVAAVEEGGDVLNSSTRSCFQWGDGVNFK